RRFGPSRPRPAISLFLFVPQRKRETPGAPAPRTRQPRHLPALPLALPGSQGEVGSKLPPCVKEVPPSSYSPPFAVLRNAPSRGLGERRTQGPGSARCAPAKPRKGKPLVRTP